MLDDMAQFDDDDITVKTLVQWIKDDGTKILKMRPMKQGATSTIHINIKGKTLVLTVSQLMSGPAAFITQMADIHSLVLYSKQPKWHTFVKFVIENAVDGGDEETAASMAADIIFEQMCAEMEITDDKGALLDMDRNDFVRHNPHGDQLYYVVQSALMAEKLADIAIPAKLPDVSEAMSIKGFKKFKTAHVKPSGRCWWFISEIVDGVKRGNSDV